MPILGLTETRRLPRVGKIHLGAKKVASNGKEYPTETDYFVVPPELARLLGTDKPKELRIMFPVEDPEVFFQQWWKCYCKSALLKCKGDGERAFTYDEKAAGLTEIKCPCFKAESKECKRIATLQFLMPDVPGAGVWQITTSSINSIININSSIAFIRGIAGRVRMIPLVLKRKEEVMQRMENGQPKSSKHYILHLDVDENVSLKQLQQFGQSTPETMFLPPPDETKDELYFPPEGFAPAEKTTVDAQTGEVVTEAAMKFHNLLWAVREAGIEVSEKELARIGALKTDQEFEKATKYYEDKLKKAAPPSPKDQAIDASEPGQTNLGEVF